MFQKCLEFVEQVPDRETKEILLNSVRTNTEGKVYVEVERAHSHPHLGCFQRIRPCLQGGFLNCSKEVAVETFSSMERKEKYDFILEQMRLALITEYNQAQIISRKINPKIFNNDS